MIFMQAEIYVWAEVPDFFPSIHQEQIELAMKLFKIVFNLNMQNMIGTVGKV